MAERTGLHRRNIQYAVAALPGLVTGLVLLGWSAGDRAMTHLWFTSDAMNPVTAAALMCFSLGLLLRPAGGTRFLQAPANWLFLVSSVIGMVTLVDDIFGTGLRPDVWLFASQLTEKGALPCRLAPNTALCLVLMSAALLLVRATGRRSRRLGEVLYLATLLLSGFALVGHLYRVAAFYAMPQFFPMAAHTALCFIALGTYALLDSSGFGFARLLANRGPGGRMMRHLLPAAVLLPICFGWVACSRSVQARFPMMQALP